MRSPSRYLLLFAGLLILSTGLLAQPDTGLSIEFEKYTLDNGLDVVLHIDRSDPIVAIDIAAHVGSARETPGRTGFAHLFEHLLFLDSENLGYGGLDEMNTRIGGEGTNGFTNRDMTQYFQAVPADALEKVIWAEADKLGYFINTVTQPVVDNEKQVVKNEKRQSSDNRPYGHRGSIVSKTLYPPDHPYSWTVIGSLADLDAATLQDVKDFYARWYVPNNVTLTITGDFDTAEAKVLVEKYFGEIPRGADVQPREPRASDLSEIKSLYHEDNFARVPQLGMVWPSVPQYHPDSYPLGILTQYLASGKRAPLNEVLIDEEKLTSGVSAFNRTAELAGEIYLTVNANAGTDLDLVLPAIEKGLERFEANGISQEDLDRIKAGLEVQFYSQIEGALGKAIQLGEYNLFADDPGFLSKDIANIQAVTVDDVSRVYQEYIKGKPYVATSFVPKGSLELALEGAEKADVVEEAIVQGAEAEVEFDPTARTFEPTPSSFDRTIEPAFGDPYTLAAPPVWTDELPMGIKVWGIENSETPLVTFSLTIDAGRERASVEKPAVASLTADMLQKGTATRTTAELEDAIQALGSSINISANNTGTVVSGRCVSRNFGKTIELVGEMLLSPRWDETEFELLKRQRINELDQAEGNPNAIAAREVAQVLYPEDHILSYRPYGTKEKLEAVTLDDLKAFYEAYYTGVGARLVIAGNVSADDVRSAFDGDQDPGPGNAPVLLPQANDVEESRIYFYDVPGAKQSVLYLVRPTLSALDPDYPLVDAINFTLGEIYTSRLNTELRVNKGYTYGIGSRFLIAKDRGEFSIRSSVRTNVTLESLQLIKQVVENYGPDFTEDDLTVLKGALLRGMALKNETLGAKLRMLRDISTYGYPADYRAVNAARIEAMTLDQVKDLAARYMRPDAMNYIIVGDAETQAGRLGELGFGDVVLLNP